MKKKVLYGAALALFASVSMGTLQSCKDDLSDLKHVNAYEHKVFTDQLNALRADLDNCRQNCSTEIAALKVSIADLQSQITANKADADATKALAKQLEADLKTLSDKVALMYTSDQIDTKLNALETALKAYSDAEDVKLKAALEATIDQKVTEVNALITKVSDDLEALKTDFNTKHNALADKVTALETENATQQAAIEAAQNEIDLLWQKCAQQDENISQVYNALNDELTELKGQYESLQQNLDQLTQDIYGVGGLQEQMMSLYNVLREDMEAADADIWEMIDQVRNEASMYWRATEATLEELRNEDEQLWQQMSQLQDMLGQVLKVHQDDIEALEGNLADLEIKYNNLLGRMTELITGILIQGTDNPIFGNFSLPLGIKTNMLFNWYGYNNLEEFQFPNAGSEYNYYDTDNKPIALTFDDLRELNPTLEEIKKGYLGEVDLGRLYLTVNPFNHNFDNTALSLETTDGDRLPYELRVKKSDEKLFWGPSTRGTVQGNGFYSADVVMPATAEAVNKTKIEIEEGLKTAAKDLLKDRSKRNAVNMLKALYSQMTDMLPFYGVRYDWTADGKPYGVMSNYDLAVATARPLSYSFLYGKGTTKHLPTFDHLDNIFENLIDKDKLNIKIPQNFHVDGFEFDFTGMDITLSASPDITYNETITVTIPGFTAEGTDEQGNRVTVDIPDQHADLTPEQLGGLIDAIKNGFTGAIDEMNEQLKGQLNDQIRTQIVDKLTSQVNDMLKNIEDSVNDMLADLEKEINGQISDMIDDIMSSIEDKTGGLFNKVNYAIDIYNKVARKINNILKDPNHYLQVAMFYKGNGTVGILSNSKKSPTVFKNAGGNAISLYASSYSAEILAPAYKKYIAVSNVYDAKGNELTNEKANLAAINAASGLNKVFPGVTKRVGVAASKLKKNLVYEIVYQGVDYSGKTSTQKFYITVK